MTRRHKLSAVGFFSILALLTFGSVPAHSSGDVRLTNDTGGGYVSNYTMVTGIPYTDQTITNCSNSRGRQNEPAVAVDPRNPDVIVGSSNDYCPVFNQDGTINGIGSIWLGYYRSENGGDSFVSSLVPGYPGDTSPYAANAHLRTASSGDAVLAWDNQGRLFAGSESSGDPAGSAKTFGDVWVGTFENPGGVNGDHANDGKKFIRALDVATGSSAPGLLGVFHDKTSIEVDRTGGACEGTVYFAWARFTGNTTNGDNSSVYIVRSTDHGATFSAPLKISQTVHDIQFPDIAITHNGHVYVTYRQFADVRSQQLVDGIAYNKSTDCGQSFSAARKLVSFEPYDPTDVAAPNSAGDAPKKNSSTGADPDAGEAGAAPTPGSIVGDCGDFASHCASGYTFMRGGTQIRSTSDQTDPNEYIYLAYDPSIPGTEVNSGTTYGSIVSEDLPDQYHQTKGSQSGIYFFRLNGATGAHTTPTLIDDPGTRGGLQRFPDISADQGSLHAIWWDSRNDSCYSPARPLGNCADRSTVPSIDAFGSTASTSDLVWSDAARLSTQTSNPNWEQFGGRTVPFGGDYLYISSVGDFSYGTWTDWRNVVAGTDPRETNDAEGSDGADVHQCRAQRTDGSFGADTCPWAGGLDQNIYGSTTP
jgi:hypothetical protein